MVRFQKLNLGPCHEIHAFPLILKSELSGQELEQLELITNNSGTASNHVGIDSGCDSGTLGSRLTFFTRKHPLALPFETFRRPRKPTKLNPEKSWFVGLCYTIAAPFAVLSRIKPYFACHMCPL